MKRKGRKCLPAPRISNGIDRVTDNPRRGEPDESLPRLSSSWRIRRRRRRRPYLSRVGTGKSTALPTPTPRGGARVGDPGGTISSGSDWLFLAQLRGAPDPAPPRRGYRVSTDLRPRLLAMAKPSRDRLRLRGRARVAALQRHQTDGRVPRVPPRVGDDIARKRGRAWAVAYPGPARAARLTHHILRLAAVVLPCGEVAAGGLATDVDRRGVTPRSLPSARRGFVLVSGPKGRQDPVGAERKGRVRPGHFAPSGPLRGPPPRGGDAGAVGL